MIALPAIEFAKLLKPKNLMYLAGLALLLFGAYKVYNFIYDRGHDSRDKEVAEITATKDEAERKYNEYKSEYDEWVQNTKNAQAQYIREQEARLKETEKRLAEAEDRARDKPVTIQEVIKYVPVEVDRTYALPSGLVRLYNETLQGRATAVNPSTGLPEGISFDASEASGLKVSQFGQIIAYNNAECVLRGAVISEWQLWYEQNKADFERLQKYQQENAPKPK